MFPFLLQSTVTPFPWPALLISLLTFALGILATWFWKVRDERKKVQDNESQALTDLKQKQMQDILKIEGTLGIIVSTLDRFVGTTETVATITERVAGQGQKIEENRQDIIALRNTLQPQVAKLQADLDHLRHV